MSYHVECYEKATGRVSSRSPVSTKTNPDTGKPYVCQHCGQDIMFGQRFCWVSNSKENQRFRRAEQEAFGEGTPMQVNEENEAADAGQAIEAPKAAGQKGNQGEAKDAGIFAFNAAALALSLIPHLERRFSPVSDSKVGETVTRIFVERAEVPGVEVDVGIQHKSFATLVRVMATGKNVWISGPMGGGKTTGVINAAKALGKKFYYTGAINDAFALMGFIDAHGKYAETPFFKAFTGGGVFLWDEVDGCDANAVLAFQAALENGHCAFPHGVFEKHPDFVCVAAANTWGLGATAEYVGRNRLDAAFLDRFIMLDWPYDEALELATAPLQDWTRFVQETRAKVKEKGIKVAVTPRASYQGGVLLKAGLDLGTVVRSCLRKCMTEDQWNSIRPSRLPQVTVLVTPAIPAAAESEGSI